MKHRMGLEEIEFYLVLGTETIYVYINSLDFEALKRANESSQTSDLKYRRDKYGH